MQDTPSGPERDPAGPGDPGPLTPPEADPAPVQPAPTDPAPTDPAPTDPAPAPVEAVADPAPLLVLHNAPPGRRAERRAERSRRRSGRRTAAVLASAALVVVLAGGYAVADAADLVPGVLTTEPLPVADPPPVAPGAELVLPAARALAAVPAGETTPDPAALAATLAPLLADPALGGSVGLVVVDAATGEVLADVDGATPKEPASVAKVLTATAALHVFGAEATLTTEVVQGGAPDQVVLVGGGDVLLGDGAGDPTTVTGRAGLADLAGQTAAALQAAGTTSVALLLDDSLTGGGPSTSPAWDPTDLTAGFVAPLSALAVDAGRLADERYAQRVPDPALSAAEAFAGRLGEQGITVTSTTRGTAPAGAPTLAAISSAPLRDVVARMFEESDNTVAESLAHLVAVRPAVGPDGAVAPGASPAGSSGAAPDFAASGRAVLAAVADAGVPVDGAVLADGSGLGRGSLVSAAQLAGVLAAAAADAPDGDAALHPVVTGLPVAALTGTLSSRFLTTDGASLRPGAGLVRAKTGSLLGVTSLAGSVVDADGRQLVFAVLADAVTDTDAARRAVDGVAGALAGCGCR